MRRMDLDQVVAALKQPIEDFVGETRVRIALLINRSGQVLGQYGFTRKYEVVNVASLAAAANAAAAALAQLHITALPDDLMVLLAARAGAPAGWVVRTAQRATELSRAFLGGGV